MNVKKLTNATRTVFFFDVFTPALPSCCGRDGRFYRPPAEDVCTPRIRSVIILVLFHRMRVRKGSNII